jgi:hypothetical protein
MMEQMLEEIGNAVVQPTAVTCTLGDRGGRA